MTQNVWVEIAACKGASHLDLCLNELQDFISGVNEVGVCLFGFGFF